MKRNALLPVLAALLAAGCSDSAGPLGEQELQVRIRVISPSVAPGASLSAAAAATNVAVERAVFVLGGLKLETAGVDQTVDWTFDESVVIPLDLTGTPVLAFDVGVPPGIYKELELSIDKLEPGNPAEDPLIAEWEQLADASVMVEGTVTRDDGSTDPFTFTAPIDVDLEVAFPAPVEFPDDGNPVRLFELAIDLGRWFDGASPLDPTDPANRSDIEGNIEASLDIYEDD